MYQFCVLFLKVLLLVSLHSPYEYTILRWIPCILFRILALSLMDEFQYFWKRDNPEIIVNPPNHPDNFSVIPGGVKRISYPGENCRHIKVNSFTPNTITSAYLTKVDSIVITKNLEEILTNHTLEVGYAPDQLTYYGVPVSEGDEIILYVRSANISIDSLSITISVYDTTGFSKLSNDITSNNINVLNSYELDSNCLLSVSGCMVSSSVISDDWLYFVFESTPTPSTLVVTLKATVRKYDLDLSEILEQCTLSELSTRCLLIHSESKNMTDLPFTITYVTEYLLSNSIPSSQSLNVSVDLSWSCFRIDIYDYIIVSSAFGSTLLCSLCYLILLIRIKISNEHGSYTVKNPRNCDQTLRTSFQLENSSRVEIAFGGELDVASYITREDVPPSYQEIQIMDDKREIEKEIH
ncbi:hypothetical protein LOD99_10598 [Oopsacas minuta]|uniref:Uncharacterized protein n=1 Tax=Oopsacas minuta TaxID=111878 RepID=A0AAV7KH07_9METZ|nr:hypothetical protein LOD99_10598 [Oopsacas minuta]